MNWVVVGIIVGAALIGIAIAFWRQIEFFNALEAARRLAMDMKALSDRFDRNEVDRDEFLAEVKTLTERMNKTSNKRIF